MHRMAHTGHTASDQPTSSAHAEKQRPFAEVAPLLQAALLLGVGGGFTLATILTLTRAFSVPLGPWWGAMAQAHGHLQLYGWAGLFVLGVALHFMPRLRGTPLAFPRSLPWLMGLLVTSLILRAVSQPLLTMMPSLLWRVMLIGSGIVEVGALAIVLVILMLTARHGPRAETRPAYWGVLPLLLGAFCSLGLASIVNLVNVLQAAWGDGLVLPVGDGLNVTLGLFGFLLPIALAMSARSLPMYAGLESFPRRVLWPVAGGYFVGLILVGLSTISMVGGTIAAIGNAVGMVVMGGTVLFFIGTFLRLMRVRGRVPQRVAQLAPSPEEVKRGYQRHIQTAQTKYGPFVGLVASSYLWAMLGGLLLLIDGIGLLLAGTMPIDFDAIRHSFALGFIALLICGIAPRMLPSFSGHAIVSPKLVSATLWLGNSAAVLRVGSILLAPLLASLHENALELLLFGLSGPVGLALASCLAINLWPVISSHAPHEQ